MFSLLFILTSLLTDTASTEVSVQGTFGQSTMAITGIQNGGFAIDAHAVYDFSNQSATGTNPRHRVFGEASYTCNESKGNQWVENSDYERLYPMLTCDTVGGDMHTEDYHFRGGYRMIKPIAGNHADAFIWHVGLAYSARQSYRTVDPRPRNKVANLQADVSVGFAAKGHAFSWLLHAGRYKQNNDVKFYSELGEAMVYHLITTDSEYARFNSFKSAYYHGYDVGIGFMVQPELRGFIAGINYDYSAITKELSSSTAIPISTLRTHNTSAIFGYHTPVWHVAAEAILQYRGVWQSVYGNAANNTYTLLVKEQRYAEQWYRVAVSGGYTLGLPVGKMTFAADASYQATHIRQQSGSARFTALSEELLSPQIGIDASVRYAFPLLKKENSKPRKLNLQFFIKPAAAYSLYNKTTHQRWQVVLHAGICF